MHVMETPCIGRVVTDRYSFAKVWTSRPSIVGLDAEEVRLGAGKGIPVGHRRFRVRTAGVFPLGFRGQGVNIPLWHPSRRALLLLQLIAERLHIVPTHLFDRQVVPGLAAGVRSHHFPPLGLCHFMPTQPKPPGQHHLVLRLIVNTSRLRPWAAHLECPRHYPDKFHRRSSQDRTAFAGPNLARIVIKYSC